jgi:hypothetical protein
LANFGHYFNVHSIHIAELSFPFELMISNNLNKIRSIEIFNLKIVQMPYTSLMKLNEKGLLKFFLGNLVVSRLTISS